jgi:hypothetical protein
MTSKTEKISFEILWYAGGPEHAPNRCIGRDYVKRHDLTDAITAACNMLKSGKGAHDGYAHGFYVQKDRRETTR